jgi:hypothetical protein
MAGIFISKGMTLTIPEGGLTIEIDDDGNITGGNVNLHLRYDVCSTWTKLSLQHLQQAKVKKSEREAVWAGTNEEKKGPVLEREFEASMQAIVSAAVAIDAFYSIIKTHIVLPPEITEQWRTERTSRYKQVAEVLRQAFNLKPEGVAVLRHNLKEIYRMRDLAIHPSGKIEAPKLHPELNVGVEWRFACFRAHSAELIVNAATWILWTLAHDGKPNDSTIAEYMNGLRQGIVELFPNGHPFDPNNRTNF